MIHTQYVSKIKNAINAAASMKVCFLPASIDWTWFQLLLIQSKGHIINTRWHQCSTQCCIHIVRMPLERKLCSDEWCDFGTTMPAHKLEELQSYLTNILINFDKPFRIIQHHPDSVNKFALAVLQLNNFLFRRNAWWRSWGQGTY